MHAANSCISNVVLLMLVRDSLKSAFFKRTKTTISFQLNVSNMSPRVRKSSIRTLGRVPSCCYFYSTLDYRASTMCPFPYHITPFISSCYRQDHTVKSGSVVLEVLMIEDQNQGLCPVIRLTSSILPYYDLISLFHSLAAGIHIQICCVYTD